MRPLLQFFALTFLLSWASWLGAAALQERATPLPGLPALRGFLYLLGVFAPSLVALGLTARAQGVAAAGSLLGQILAWSAPARLYAFAIFYMAAIKLTVAVLIRIGTGAWPAFGSESVYVMAFAIVVSTPVQAGEEIGWRGYALPRLSARLGLAGASIVLGILWAVWHLPFFFVSGADKSGQSFPMYVVTVTALSVAMAWLYWRTNGSLLLTMLLHAAVNNTKDLVPSAVAGATNPFSLSASLVGWLTAALLWVCAAFLLLRMRGARLREASG